MLIMMMTMFQILTHIDVLAVGSDDVGDDCDDDDDDCDDDDIVYYIPDPD